MNYLIYKITNKLNNKIYVGKHKTDFMMDGYMGSGLLLKRAMKKHGTDQFTREILFECKTEEEMNQKEADIVDDDFIMRDDTYNIKLGGEGGFDYINKNKLGVIHKFTEKDYEKADAARRYKWENSPRFRELTIDRLKTALSSIRKEHGHHWTGRKHTENTIKKISDSMKGKHSGKNSPWFGKHWITNGKESKMVDKSVIPDGWRKGRV